MENQNTDKSLQTESGASSSTHETYRDAEKSFRKELWKTGVFVTAGLIALIFGAIAWFVSNSRVQSETVSVSARHEVVRIASKGSRQEPEQSFLSLEAGTEYSYKGTTYYYTESGEIALYLSEEYVVSPGATGVAEFFIIPTHDGAMTVNLHIGLAGYKENIVDETSARVERVTDPILDALLSGHILLFENYENRHYSGWLSNEDTGGILNNTITITLPEDTKKGEPYPVRIYWIWPLRYENMLLDLYEDQNAEYTEHFHPFIEDQASKQNMSQISGIDYYYSRIFLTKEAELNDKDSRTRAYNLADEYIGSNADYLYLTIKTAAYES